MSCDDKSSYMRFRGLPQSRAVGETRGYRKETIEVEATLGRSQ
jgi:hypothetical protein